MRTRTALIFALLVVLSVPASAVAAATERGDQTGNRLVGWFLERLQPLLAVVLPEAAGPDADPNGLTAPSPPGSEGDAGPDADPNG